MVTRVDYGGPIVPMIHRQILRTQHASCEKVDCNSDKEVLNISYSTLSLDLDNWVYKLIEVKKFLLLRIFFIYCLKN